MKLAAHQPCFLPNLSFFYKLTIAEVFVIADDYQFTTHNFINRAKIKTINGVDWLTIPVLTKGLRNQLIKDVKINDTFKWRDKHLRTLKVNYTYSPFFEQYIDGLIEIYKKQHRFLIDINLELIEFIRDSLNIATKVLLCSDLSLKGGKNQKIFNMLTAMECDTYLAESDLSTYLSKSEFENDNLKLEFFVYNHPSYHQLFENFAPQLSIIDLLFNEGNESLDILLTNKLSEF